MMAGGAVQQNGIFSNPHHHNQQPHMESDPPDSRKRPLETPTEASSTKRTNTGVFLLRLKIYAHAATAAMLEPKSGCKQAKARSGWCVIAGSHPSRRMTL
ncbi:RNA-binding protein Nova-1 [Nibea albiflora]|uniref:RNA-binding protein Nova-1 n=1 Tax=Nibea albiflora TaxID=240163 RepID=A0ACB7EHW4_NIBAL|nr:RNA-binding protein Nova-1 [Nibea albiflora]